MQWAEASCTMSAQQYLRGGREMSSPASDVGYLALSQSVSSLHWLYIPTEPIGVAMRQIASALQASVLTCIQYHSHKGRVQQRVVSDQGLRPMQQPSKWNQAPGPHYFQSLPVGKKASKSSHLRLHTYRAADGGAQALDSLVAVSIEGHLAIGHLNDPAIAAIPNLQSSS